jgi:formamidopyrimidine-DNA glycosylase
MPELPDIAAYISALEPRIVGQPVEHIRLASPFLLRTVQPSITDVEGRIVRELRRIGKRIAIGVEGDLWLVLHLMIAGRLHWRPRGAKLAGRKSLAAFDFPNGSLVLTEAGTKHRASLYLFAGEDALQSVDPGGIDVFSSNLASFREALTAENRTLKRALTDPRILSGIGNAYSDEILHAAQLSPITLTQKLKPDEWERLFAATRDTLKLWIDRLRAEAESGFPEKVTAFRKEWQFMDATVNRAPDVAKRFSGFATRTMKPTIVLAAKPAGKFWLIEVCPGCCDPIGRVRWMSSKLLSAARMCRSRFQRAS